jgi:hypothetical protein
LDFGSLQHTKVRKSTSREASTPHFVPPSGFGYPLDGLLLPSPCRVCFAPTALLGFTLRSVPLPKGIRGVSARKHPRAVFPAGTVAAEANDPSRPAAAPGLRPFRESLAIRGVFSTPGRRMLPWVSPFQGMLARALIQNFFRSPLTRFSRLLPEGRAGRRPRVSIGPRWVSSVSGGESSHGRGSPLRVFAPVRS